MLEKQESYIYSITYSCIPNIKNISPVTTNNTEMHVSAWVNCHHLVTSVLFWYSKCKSTYSIYYIAVCDNYTFKKGACFLLSDTIFSIVTTYLFHLEISVFHKHLWNKNKYSTSKFLSIILYRRHSSVWNKNILNVQLLFTIVLFTMHVFN